VNSVPPDHFPARYTVERIARRLDCTVESVYVLTRRRLLKPLGNPPPNGTKYYAAVYIERLCQDEAWLARMSDALVKYKWDKNHQKEASAT
jgi:transposase-like protein